jgi:hypothetical protein
MSTTLPFHSVVLGLRLVYDKAYAFVQEALDQEVTDIVFRWSGTRLHFDATLTSAGEKYVALAKRGVHTYQKRISGDIEHDVVLDLTRFEQEAYRSMEELRALDNALAELSLGASRSQAMGNNGLSFELLTFRIDGPLQKLYDNWSIRNDVFTAARNHYQARMAQGRAELDPLVEPVVQHYYYDGSLSPWGEEQ